MIWRRRWNRSIRRWPRRISSFVAADGSEHHLTDFLGHGMVINLWATWCAPCVAEMPSLAALSKTLAPDDIAVLPLSSDRGGARAVGRFFRSTGSPGCRCCSIRKGAAAHAWHVRGIPTSIDHRQARDSRRAQLEGSADWSTPAAAAMVRKLVRAVAAHYFKMASAARPHA